ELAADHGWIPGAADRPTKSGDRGFGGAVFELESGAAGTHGWADGGSICAKQRRSRAGTCARRRHCVCPGDETVAMDRAPETDFTTPHANLHFANREVQFEVAMRDYTAEGACAGASQEGRC